jgi:hypothetical protein
VRGFFGRMRAPAIGYTPRLTPVPQSLRDGVRESEQGRNLMVEHV